PRLRSWLPARVACSGAVRRCMPPFPQPTSPVSIRAGWPWPCRRVSTLSAQGAAVDEAVWHTLATPSLTDSTPTAPSGLARVQRALLFALVALVTTTFVGGGLFAAALALVVLSRRPTDTALMVPAPVRDALGTVTSAAVAVRSPSLFAVLPDWQGTEPFSIL